MSQRVSVGCHVLGFCFLVPPKCALGVLLVFLYKDQSIASQNDLPILRFGSLAQTPVLVVAPGENGPVGGKSKGRVPGARQGSDEKSGPLPSEVDKKWFKSMRKSSQTCCWPLKWSKPKKSKSMNSGSETIAFGRGRESCVCVCAC